MTSPVQTSKYKLGPLARFGMVAAQLALLTLVVRTFDIESGAFFRVMVIASIGFVVHHLAPSRLRLPLFVLISVAGIVTVLGPANAAQIVGLGLLLIGIAHLPVRFSARVALILALGGLLAAARVGVVRAPLSTAIWPIFGAMFMFRMIVYLYDLKNRAAPFGPWRALAYFFMLPNVCFPLFPVVDYKSFCRTYYDDEDVSIYQTGVEWIFNGIVQLLIYRWVYQNLLVGPDAVANASQAALFLFTAYAMYLKISGSFHMIVGILHVFGFNLGPTNNKYFLSQSFTDYWRRINIYWKDFLQKVFFNPVYFRLNKKMGATSALVFATLVAFFVTWALHSYQWFWIRGNFPVIWQDIAFWSIMGLLVLGNMLYENKYGRQRSLKKAKVSAASEVTLALRTVGTFVVICVSWVIWSSESFGEVTMVLGKLARPDLRAVLWIVLGLGALGAIAIAVARHERGKAGGALARASRKGPAPILGRAYQVGAACVAILFIAYAPLVIDIDPAISNTVDNLKTSRLNARDAQMLDRGYYEDLTNVVRFNTTLGDLYNEKPPNWERCWAMHPIDGYPDYEFMPNKNVWFKGTMMSTNQWGLRDRDCEKSKPAGTYRIAMLGASHPMGTGVEDDQVMDNVAEDRLTRESPTGEHERYEILNFSVGGYGPIQMLADMDRRVFDFEFDALLWTGIDDIYWTAKDLVDAANHGFAIPYPHVMDVMREAGIGRDTPFSDGLNRMKPHSEALLSWIYAQVVERCAEHGVVPMAAFLPHMSDISDEHELLARKARQMELARAAGMVVLDLTKAYRGVDPRTMWIAPWDSHPNADGHRMLGDELYEALKVQLAL
ncbi:MAG TPA: SGNH/GDSL hydrolase family protein [Candidatus Krumholzibacteria bacterium]|nr:SGNH/GDSL hydrolase family protein [Candidatus Krumholzibacteria bacterium]